MTVNALREKRLRKSLKRKRIHKAKASNVRAPKLMRLEQSAKSKAAI